jgi:hypothetical protein
VVAAARKGRTGAAGRAAGTCWGIGQCWTAGAVPAGARAAVPRMDSGPGAVGGHRVGAAHPRAGVRRPPLVDPRPSQLRAAPLLFLTCFDLVSRCHVLIDSVGFVFACSIFRRARVHGAGQGVDRGGLRAWQRAH